MDTAAWWRYYHDIGFSTCPLRKKDKRPLFEWKKYQDEQPSLAEINLWTNKYKDYNVAVITGAVSGIIVLDIDGQEGWDYLTQNGYDLPITPRAQSSPGKAHIYFKHPNPEKGVRTRVNTELKIDVKGDGGYVVAPPSIHKLGHRYQWVEGFAPQDVPLADTPQWLIDFIAQYAQGASPSFTAPPLDIPPANGEGPKEAELESRPGQAGVKLERPQDDPVTGDVDELTHLLKGVSKGGRNNACAKIAGTWIAQNMTPGSVWQMLLAWNLKNSPPMPEQEIHTVLESIVKRDARSRLKNQDFKAPPKDSKEETPDDSNDIRTEDERREDRLEGINKRLQIKILKIEKYLGEKPQYVFHVAGRNGHGPVEVWLTAAEMLTQASFRSKMLGATNQVVPPIKADKKKGEPGWDTYAQRMADCAVDVEVGAEATIVGEILSSLRGYIQQHTPQDYAIDNQITEHNHPFKFDGKTWINFSDFRRWMLLFRVAVKVTHQELSQRLRHCGFVSKKFVLPGRDKPEKYWHVPDNLLELEKTLTGEKDEVK